MVTLRGTVSRSARFPVCACVSAQHYGLSPTAWQQASSGLASSTRALLPAPAVEDDVFSKAREELGNTNIHRSHGTLSTVELGTDAAKQVAVGCNRQPTICRSQCSTVPPATVSGTVATYSAAKQCSARRAPVHCHATRYNGPMRLSAGRGSGGHLGRTRRDSAALPCSDEGRASRSADKPRSGAAADTRACC